MLKKETISRVLKKRAKNNDLTQSFLAKELGVTRSTINLYFNNSPKSLVHAMQLLEILELEFKDFYKNGD